VDAAGLCNRPDVSVEEKHRKRSSGKRSGKGKETPQRHVAGPRTEQGNEVSIFQGYGELRISFTTVIQVSSGKAILRQAVARTFH
jgi:hypothetical protein